MINYLKNLLLVKEIISKTGELHFKRWRFFSCPWFRIYLHKICKSDEDAHLHTHPWNFLSIILKGGYTQEYWDHILDNRTSFQTVEQFDILQMTKHEGHKITLNESPIWTLVFAYGTYENWGYLVPGQGYVDHKIYRDKKNNGEL